MAEEKSQQRRQSQSTKATTIIRIAGKDIDGSLNIWRALTRVKGIGFSMSNALCNSIESKLSIKRTTPISELSEQQVADIEEIIKTPAATGIPIFMLNKKKDMEHGSDMHYVGNDLLFSNRQDINRMVNLRSWRGLRHQFGQKVRGQRTRSTGRRGAAVGVMKKAAKATAAATSQKAQEASAPKAEKPAAK